MSSGNVFMLMLVFLIILGVALNFLLSKLNLKSLNWIAETSKRRNMARLILLIITIILIWLIDSVNLKYERMYTMIVTLVGASIVGRISQLADKKYTAQKEQEKK